MRSERADIVCYAGDNYWFSNPHSRYHLMRALHRAGHRVLWVNSIGMNMPKLGRPGAWKRVWMRLRSWSRWLKRAEPGFTVLSPIALPLFGNPALERVNDAWIAAQVRLACLLAGVRRPLVFASMPAFAGVVARLPRSGLIYYYSDKYVAYRDIDARESIAALDRQLLDEADAVFCASLKVCEDLQAQGRRAHYLPHAVDFRHFHGALAAETPVPEDLARIPRPWIGYFGSITDSNDQELIHHAATGDPRLHFVLIGRVLGDYSRLTALPNVHFLGFKPYAELPLYGKHFDAAFMSWKMTDWIKHSNPLKTKEYLSLGLPVVSVAIDELEREYADVVDIAHDGPEFLQLIREALAADSPESRRRRIERVRGESWDARAAEMIRTYEETRRDA